MNDVKQDKNNPLFNQPYAQVSFNATGACEYQILINDVPVYTDKGAMRASVPVNQFMQDGVNDLAITVKDTDNTCNVSASLEIRKLHGSDNISTVNRVSFSGEPINATDKAIADSTKAEKLAFKDDDFKPAEDGYITVNQAKLETGKQYYGYNPKVQQRELMDGIKVSQEVNLPLDLPHWSYLDGETIANDQATKDALIAIYKEIWVDIQNKNWDKLNKLFALRDKEMKMLDGEETNTVAKIKKTAESADTKELLVPNEENMKNLRENLDLNVFGHAKLVSLTSWNGDNILIFNTSYGNVNYGLRFARINGKFEIVR